MAWKKYGSSGGGMFKFKNEGDSLQGFWQGHKKSTKYSGYLGKIKVPDGEIETFSISAALEDIMALPIGTKVKIVYLGYDVTAGGTSFKKFDMFVPEELDETHKILSSKRDSYWDLIRGVELAQTRLRLGHDPLKMQEDLFR